MPEWTLWMIPCVFALVFAYTVVAGAVRTRRAEAGEQPSRPSCPSGHRDAVPVEGLDGELVAWLCVDPECGRQLSKDWPLPSVDMSAADQSRLLVDPHGDHAPDRVGP